MKPSCHIFVGPSGFGVEFNAERLTDVIWHPPVKRGDVERLISDAPLASIAIVDGTFHRFPAVGHIEIRDALNAGWDVWGLCSMGAIRASEMAEFGMRGFGSIYQMFRLDKTYPDDEVTLLHSSEQPYVPLSEPLVHLRFYVKFLASANILSDHDAASLVDWLRNRWYGDRSVRNVLAWIKEHHGHKTEQSAKEAAELVDFRLKQRDLKAFLELTPWRKNGTDKYI